MRIINGDETGFHFDFDMEYQGIEFLDCSARYVPRRGCIPIVTIYSKEYGITEAWRGEWQGYEDAFKQAKTVRDYILKALLKAGLNDH